MSTTILLSERTGPVKKLREQGQVPAVVYSSRMDSEHVTVPEKEIRASLKRNPHAILNVALPSKSKESVIIHHVQKDSLTGQLLHVDFLQIDMKEKLDTTIAIHFIGEAKGTKEGGILQVESHEVMIRCMPNKLPESLALDISTLSIGEHLTVADLKVPKNVEVLSDPETVLVTILGTQKLDTTPEADAQSEAATE
ncbi:50S ribosomal protein L25 [Paenibacillus sp. CGMCC 1.16610]|uniref:Large ribosomal subunit protein bL25 n=1 Tax=Paenibacillus anseongense TaxID=2682845 RepID=A0ABW9U3Q5_9BACL|nr:MULTISPECIES: 50S ribosomal protein L25 [Paenibacillus]MBA2940953.1 50S ribosomal protein L25 [Paenibacillus sp. CGMCC 1.16610]MVQ34136.1 50S ribosomal protein L25 [Paenibacillus anseongense]